MKAVFNISGWVLFVLFGLSSSAYAQDKQDIKNYIDAKRFVFNAQSATPMGGRFVQLTGGYDLKISPDSVISYLPYYGRAYSAPLDPSKSGIQFTSTKFEYTKSERKKGGWDIVIKPKDVQDPRQLILTVSAGGNATLQVISNDRQAISFSGYITATSR